ncbi:MAG: hypothetical protein CMM93_09395 [Rickettsiales bacterium]|nr:hypothetical protein [Rickettsiales bacterium]
MIDGNRCLQSRSLNVQIKCIQAIIEIIFFLMINQKILKFGKGQIHFAVKRFHNIELAIFVKVEFMPFCVEHWQ